jgi:hypothetical protein
MATAKHELGGVETAIRCSDASLLEELCVAYAENPSSGRGPELTVEYLVDESVDGEAFVARRHELVPALDAAGMASFRGPRQRHCLDMALRLSLCVAVPRLGGLILHGAAAADRRGAVLFTGPSGAGKSTIFQLLAESGRWPQLLADELLFLRRQAHTWQVHASPFGGERRAPAQAAARVRALYVLQQAARHRALPLDRPTALATVLAQTRVFSGTPAAAHRALDGALALVEDVPCFRLEFAKDPGVVSALGGGSEP